ncbi:MAG: hypothetical protein J1F69_04655 [Clostridiales bacterium]|nr:hypothetical protein [Clostridiales bacterium]
MAISKKIRYIIITILLAVASAVVAAFILPSASVAAEQANFCALSPIKTEKDDVTYFCFDNPLSVFADGDVNLVVGKSGIYYISDNSESGKKDIWVKNVPADKVYRRTTHLNNSEYLIALNDGKIAVIGSDDQAVNFEPSGAIGDITDFAVSDDMLYAVTSTQLIAASLTSTGIDESDTYVAPLVSISHSTVNAKKIAVAKGRIYISVKAVFGNKWDVCAADVTAVSALTSCRLDTVLNQSNEILSLTASAENDVIYALTRSEIVGYIPTVGGGLYRRYVAEGSDITDIYAYGDSLFTLDSLNALGVMDGDLSTERVIAASAGADNGLFNVPYGIAAKNSTLYVADTVNNRVAIYDNGGIRYIDREFRTPVSVAADNGGTIYVAYDDNKVGIFRNNAYSSYDEITITSVTLGKIRQIAVDSAKTLFILSDTGLWKVERDYTPRRITTEAYTAITLSIGKSRLYALGDNGVVMLDKSTGEILDRRAVQSGAISIAVDLNDTVFALFRDKIVSVIASDASTEYALTVDGEPYTLGDRMGQILLCFMENGLDGEQNNNYAIVLDTLKHRMFKADGNALNARFVDYSYQSPDIVGSTDAVAAQSGIVRKVRFDTPLFDYPIETKSNYTVLSGEYVILPDFSIIAPSYAPDETPEFALVLIDDVQNNRLIQGYVYRDALTEPLEYSAPPSDICTVTGQLGTIVYKWPSRNSKAVDGYAEVAKNSKFIMLDFVNPFRDGYGYYWYRIKLDDSGKEGYVPAVNVSTIDYQQANILPDYNAEIIAYKGNKIAKTYNKTSGGKYVEVPDITLKAGTKVEVVGAYDSSERYTKIKFLDEKSHKTVTCYVETVHIKYTGINIVLIVALLVISITVILAIIIVSRVYYTKKKRLSRDEEIRNSDF